MSTTTTNLGLIKPDDSDVIDVSDLNDNFDAIDAAVGTVDVQTDGDLQTQVDTLRDSVSQKAGLTGVATSAQVGQVKGTTVDQAVTVHVLGTAGNYTLIASTSSMYLWDHVANKRVWYITPTGN